MSIKNKFAAVAVASALILGGVGAAQSAQAAPISGGTITLTPSSGNVSDPYFVTGMTVSAGAPAGYRGASSTWIFQNGVNMGGFSNLRKPATDNTTYGDFGLDGTPASLDRSISPGNPYLTNKQLTGLNFAGTPSILQTGNFELRYYYHQFATSIDLVNEPYATITLNYDSVSGAWAVPATVVPPVATTTSLTASASGTSVTLSATVKKSSDSSVATASAGSVSFFEGATQVGTTQTVAAGLASVSLTGVANGAHSYTATFTPSNTVYSASTSASASVSVGSLIAPTDTAAVPVGITFDIAAGTNGGALQLTSHDSTVALGTATIGGGTFNASGTLHAVVDDSRQAGSPDWNLTGVMGDFAAGTKTLSGKYLGWTPAVAAGSVGNAGAVVLPAPGSVNGLKTSSQLSYGSTSAADPQVTTTTVTALLALKAPKNTAAGNYAGVLTLTLI